MVFFPRFFFETLPTEEQYNKNKFCRGVTRAYCIQYLCILFLLLLVAREKCLK